ncbi:larval serum protein 2 [Musca domestica]|uniref:Larval serum protein 2 n=1 Tax=Musca domestica TaxID=7370 RepID=A0A9J7IFW2_MUSDO|nr:larval serum protein 2 [Musca domestica]
MKSFTAVSVVCLALCALGSPVTQQKFADKDFLEKQKFVLEVLQHVYQDDVFVTKFDETYATYLPWEHLEDYNNADKLTEFFDLWQHKPLCDEVVFSPVYANHVEYALGLGRLFYFAKDWKAFTHAVYWARVHVNKQLFVYALNLATVLRDDLHGVTTPAVYEVLPWHFFDVETVTKAEHQALHGFHNVKQLDNVFNVVVKSNYSNVYDNVNYDHTLAYFTEDVGLNAFYYYYNLHYPYWTKGPETHEFSKDRVGELYLYLHRQLLARYYLERLSNDLGEVPQLNVYQNYEPGYYSNLAYYKGVSFPDRPNDYNFYNSGNYDLVKELEFYLKRVADFVDTTTDDFRTAVEKLGNTLQGNSFSLDKKLYGSLDNLLREVVNEGRYYGKFGDVLPGTLSQYETSLRDPLFYSLYKELVGYYWRLAGNFPEYQKKDLEFPGVTLDTVHLPEKLTTFFEYFDSDVSNLVDVATPAVEGSSDALYTFGRNSVYEGHSFVVKARQKRVNHQPFEFTLDVTSDKTQKAVVKVFLGPKYDENGHVLNLEDNYQNFFELDHYVVDLVAGVNHLKRSSEEFACSTNDQTTYFELYKKLFDATNSDYQFPLTSGQCGFPRRLLLPLGKKGGLTYQFFFAVYPYHAPEVAQFSTYDPAVSCGVGSGSRYVDALPLGYPLERPVLHDYYFNVGNFKFYDVTVYHKEDTTNVV